MRQGGPSWSLPLLRRPMKWDLVQRMRPWSVNSLGTSPLRLLRVMEGVAGRQALMETIQLVA